MKTLLKQMKWKIFLLALALGWQPASLVSAQQIRAVATWPVLADITRQIGKELVNVESLATGVEDCSVGIPVLEAPARLDRAEGDIHPKGNPHYLSDPVRTKTCARNIATGLIRNFPQHQAAFEKNLNAYLAELDNWIARWEKMAAPLRGVKFVEYHQEWVYLADRFGMKRIGSVELRPGIEPTPNHIVNLVEMIKQEKPQLLIYGAQNPRIPKQLANETGIKVLRLDSGGGNQPETNSYIKWVDYTLRTLVGSIS